MPELSEQARILGIDLPGFFGHLRRARVGGARLRGILGHLGVRVGQVSPDDVVVVVDLEGFLEGPGRLAEIALDVVERAEVRGDRVLVPKRKCFFPHMGGLLEHAFHVVHAAQVAEAQVVLRVDLGHLLELDDRVVIARMVEVEDPQRVVAGPVVGAHGDRPLVRLLRIVQSPFVLVGGRQAPARLIAHRVDGERPLEVLDRVGIPAGAVVDPAQGRQHVGEPIVQAIRELSLRQRLRDPVALLGQPVLRPVCLG